MTSNLNAGSAACAEPSGAAHFGAPQDHTDPKPKLNGLVHRLIRSQIESRTYASNISNNVQTGMHDGGDRDSAQRMRWRDGCIDSHDSWPGAAVLLHGQLSAVSANRAHRGWA